MDRHSLYQSPYYPPRANFWSPIKHAFHDLKEIFLEWKYRVNNGEFVNRIAFLPLVIPGFGFVYAGKPRLGRLTLVLYLLSLFYFFLMLGFKEANYALGFMIFLHSLSIIYYLAGLIGTMTIKTQITFNLIISVILVPFAYYIFIKFLHSYVLIPVHYCNSVMVAVKARNLSKLSPGDLIVFHQQGFYSYLGEVNFIGGLNAGTVIAKENEKIRFSRNLAITKNGLFNKPEIYPESYEFTVPLSSVFVLTEMKVSGNLSKRMRENMQSIIIQQSIISDDTFEGYIPKIWLGRRQYY